MIDAKFFLTTSLSSVRDIWTDNGAEYSAGIQSFDLGSSENAVNVFFPRNDCKDLVASFQYRNDGTMSDE